MAIADSDHDRDRKQDGQRDRPVDDGAPVSGPNQSFDVGGFDLQRVAQEVGLGFVDHLKAQVEQPN